MEAAGRLIGRERERDLLAGILAELAEGVGGTVLVAGDAGSGKTALVESVVSSTGCRLLRGAAQSGVPVPFAPVTSALRGDLASVRGPSDVRTAVEQLATERPTILFLDDLHWADAGTVSLLHDWARPLPGLPLLVIGAYRTDELPRQHPVRALRSALRRSTAGARRHVRLEPLSREDGPVLVRRVLGDDAPDDVVATICRRSHGLPFFLEELARAVAAEDGAEAASEVVPESVKDAVLLRVAALSDPAREAVEIIAAAGSSVVLDVLGELSSEQSIEELLEAGLVVDDASGGGHPADIRFQHTLVGEAVYAATPWTRRRRLHRGLASVLESRGAPPSVVAANWLRAQDPQRARPFLLDAAEAACKVHAYRDAKESFERALATWPRDDQPAERVQAVDRLGACAERCGETTEATRAWQEVASAHAAAGEHRALADVQRRLAGIHELHNDWPRALSARSVAADAFRHVGLHSEAATELLAAASHLQSAADFTGALELIAQSSAEIDAAMSGPASAGRNDLVALRARAMGLEGLVRSKLGEGATGVHLTREALGLVLDLDLEGPAAEAYYLHADALEQAADYPAALDAWTDAFGYCESRGLEGDANLCLACLTPVLRHTGQWDRVLEVGGEVVRTEVGGEPARMVALGEMGLVLANRGASDRARRHLAPAAAFAQVYGLFGLEIDTAWGLARVDELAGDVDSAATRLRELAERCVVREERHYSVAALRWAATYFGRHGLDAPLGACTDVLARTAAATGTPEATAALAHALGEHALLEGDPQRAADQFDRALELLRAVSLPPETAECQLRAGVALAAAGEPDEAAVRLTGAYHTARTLRARPLAGAAARELEALGVDVTRRRSTTESDAVELTRREQEVLRLVATGMTNRQVGQELFLSTRTVDMHVRNMLAKLGCRTRTEAVHRARELALLEPSH